MVAISASPMPCVVTDGVPMRRPLVTNGLRGSSGMVFLFSVMPASSSSDLGLLAGELGVERPQVDDHQVVVGAAATRAGSPRPPSAAASAEALRTICWAYSVNDRVRRLVEGDRLAGDDVLERAALPAGEHRLVDRLRRARRGRQDAAAARAAQRLVRRERDDVGVAAPGWGARRRRSARRGGRRRTGTARRPRRRSPGTARGRVAAGSWWCRRRSSSGGARGRGRGPGPCRCARRPASPCTARSGTACRWR